MLAILAARLFITEMSLSAPAELQTPGPTTAKARYRQVAPADDRYRHGFYKLTS